MNYAKERTHLFRIVSVLLVSLLFFSKVYGAAPKTKTDNELLEICVNSAKPLVFDDLSAFFESKKSKNELTIIDRVEGMCEMTSVCAQRAREVSDKENAMHLKKKIENELMGLLAYCLSDFVTSNPSANN